MNNNCTITNHEVLSYEELHKLNNDVNELSDEQLEDVIGGQSPEAFSLWRVEMMNTLKIKVDGKKFNG